MVHDRVQKDFCKFLVVKLRSAKMVKKIGVSGLVVFLLSMATTGSGYASENQVSGIAALVASEPAGYLIILAAGLTLVGLRRLVKRKKSKLKNKMVYRGSDLITEG